MGVGLFRVVPLSRVGQLFRFLYATICYDFLDCYVICKSLSVVDCEEKSMPIMMGGVCGWVV